jgi:hypothetical protein
MFQTEWYTMHRLVEVLLFVDPRVVKRASFKRVRHLDDSWLSLLIFDLVAMVVKSKLSLILKELATRDLHRCSC